ncbi:Tubulin-folding cofactor D [Chlorella vulgaris]
MPTEESECTSGLRHVEEADELLLLVQRVADSDGYEATKVFPRFAQIVSKYQEQAQLLDPLLEGAVQPLAALLRTMAADPPTADLASVRGVSRLLWQLSVVRGYKTVLRFFPNDVASFEPVVALLLHLDQREQAAATDSLLRLDEGHSLWEAQASSAGQQGIPYVLLLWMSMLVLIPFDIALVDSSLSASAGGGAPAAGGTASQGSAGAAAAAGYPPIVGTILGLCQRYLASPGSSREMAAVVLGRLLTRPDMAPALRQFLGWGCVALASGDSQRASFLVPGTALAFATLFKLGQRSALLGPAAQVFPHAVQLLGSQLAATNALARKLAVKLVQRIGLVFLRPRLAAWRYQKRQKSNMSANLGAAAAAGAAAGAAAAAAAAQEAFAEAQRVAAEAAAEAEAEEDVEHAEQLEGVIEALLTGLADRDTVVRWSAAKGVGRVTGRLPRDLGDDVLGSLLCAFFTPGAGDTAWHGGCMGLAELARRGLLLPERLPEVVPLVVAALEYDVRRGPCSVGAHVRDAAAYVCWAFARAYSPHTLGDTVTALAPALITAACYDREVNCRRAAAAAFQECVGRLGSFPHGIDILTAADYFTVSVRANAYLSVAPFVAAFPPYFEPLAWHLLRSKARHWEASLRELTAQALAALVPHRPSFFLEHALPFLLPLCTDPVLEARHGAVCAVAELLPALKDAGPEAQLPAGLQVAAADLVPSIVAARLTRGKGGEVMRPAICRLVQASAAAGLPLSDQQQQCLLGQLHENLRHATPEVQAAAAAALSGFAARYLRQAAADEQQQLVRQFTAALSDAGNVAARRGGALALGALPCWLLAGQQAAVLAALAAASVPEELADERDAEARVNAVKALAAVALTLLAGQAGGGDAGGDAASQGASNGTSSTGNSTSSVATVALSAEAVRCASEHVLVPLLAALDDYSVDNRGDVGSWVREAAMEGLARLLPLLLPASQAHPAPQQQRLAELAQRALLAMLRQAVERIARMREAAASCLQQLLPAAQAVGVPLADEIAAAVSGRAVEQFSELEALPAVAALLVHPGVQPALLEGLCFSIGGLDAQLSAAAGNALADAVQEQLQEDLPRLETLGSSLLAVWRRHRGGGRMCTPLLLVADLLLSRTALRDLQPPGSSFPGQLLELVREEIKGCSDVQRLHAAAGVLCQLASLEEPVRGDALRAALLLLGNRYPKVRRYAAEQVYTMLLTFEPADDGSQDVEAAMELPNHSAGNSVFASMVVAALSAAQPASHLSRQFFGLARCLAALPRRHSAPGRSRLTVQANELNHWADRSNYDSHDSDSWQWSQFDKDTADTLLRVLTAKAVKRLLHQLMELDQFKAQWFNNYCSEHPPADGDKFLLRLFKAPSVVVREVTTGTDHTIDPANLAHRVIQIRADMAQTLVELPKYIELQNTEVLRQHLTASTYLSGSSEQGYKERRGYYRGRPQSK